MGWQILSANKAGKAERRLNKSGVSDSNVKNYLHLVGRCDVVSEGTRCGLGGQGGAVLLSLAAKPGGLVPTSDLGNRSVNQSFSESVLHIGVLFVSGLAVLESRRLGLWKGRG